MRGVDKIVRVVLAGSGVMGASFAQIFARHGFEVALYDIARDALDKAAGLIEVNQRAMVEQGELGRAESDRLRSRVSFTLDPEVFAGADFVLEAVAENMAVKHRFWEQASAAAPEDVVLATNTSGLSIGEIAKGVREPARFAGMHWVNPPHLIPLVEVIAGEKTSPEATAIVRDLALRLGQKPVLVHKDPPGFILNRLQYAIIREACHIVESGIASLEDVDRVMKYGLGRRYVCIGQFETMDFGGIDVFNHVGSYLFGQLSNETTVPRMLREAMEAGKLGVKNGSGFYDYSGGKAAEAIARRDAGFMKVAKCLSEQEGGNA